MITIYVDGSSRGNPGNGGYGFVVFDEDESPRILSAQSAQYPDVTNNRMELLGLLHALDYVEDYYPEEEVIIYSDSAYVVNSCNSWMENWARNGWLNSKKQTVENVDLMKALWEYFRRDFFHCELRKCDGHNGILGNELADYLATGKLQQFYNTADENGLIVEHFDARDFITRIIDWT